MLDAWFKSVADEVEAVERNVEEQRLVDAQTAGFVLYHYDTCMFCARVRKAFQRLRLNIELRDIMQEPQYRRELMLGGGRGTVPCLRIGSDAAGATQWLYESAAIIRYLVDRFGVRPAATEPVDA